MTDDLTPGQLQAREDLMAGFVTYLEAITEADDGLGAVVAVLQHGGLDTDEAVKIMAGYTRTVWTAGAMWMNREFTGMLPGGVE